MERSTSLVRNAVHVAYKAMRQRGSTDKPVFLKVGPHVELFVPVHLVVARRNLKAEDITRQQMSHSITRLSRSR